MTMNDNLKSIGYLYKMTLEKGGPKNYARFRIAVDTDQLLKDKQVTVVQGKHRSVIYLPEDVGVKFVDSYVKSCKREKPPITSPQMELKFKSDERLDRIESLTIVNHNMLVNLTKDLNHIIQILGAFEDDQK
jgi:hypothetical protein